MFENENTSQNHYGATAVADQPVQTQPNGKGQGSDAPSQSGPAQAGSQENTLQKIRNFRIDFGPGKKDILNFTSQLSVMIRAGISIQDALDSIGQQNDNPKFKTIILDLKSQIESGQSFSQALAEHPNVFSNLYINMIAAAEISGSLSQMLEKLAGYLDEEAETNRQIKGAMIYPAIIAIMAVAVTVFLLCFVLPKFESIFAGKEHLLPRPTKLLMGSSKFLRSYWYFIVPALTGSLWGFIHFINTSTGRLWWDKTKLQLPVIKKLCRCLYITRSLHTMGVLSQAGVPILDTISITAQISGNLLYKNMFLSVHEDVRQGDKIATSLNRHTLMPPSVIQMIRSGEDSGTMSEVLKTVSGYYARELKAVIKAVTSMIEPIMIVLMGFLVGFIAMSIMLPIFKMSKIVTSN